jgi:hypothetical protein
LPNISGATYAKEKELQGLQPTRSKSSFMPGQSSTTPSRSAPSGSRTSATPSTSRAPSTIATAPSPRSSETSTHFVLQGAVALPSGYVCATDIENNLALQTNLAHELADDDNATQVPASIFDSLTCAENKLLIHTHATDELDLLSSLNILGYIEFHILCDLSSVEKMMFCQTELPLLKRNIFHAIGNYDSRGVFMVHRIYICSTLNTPCVVHASLSQSLVKISNAYDLSPNTCLPYHNDKLCDHASLIFTTHLPFGLSQRNKMIACINANDIFHSVSSHVSLQHAQHLQPEYGWLLLRDSVTKLRTVVGHWNKPRIACCQEGENDEIVHMFAAPGAFVRISPWTPPFTIMGGYGDEDLKITFSRVRLKCKKGRITRTSLIWIQPHH